MAEELGKIERPAAETFKKGRKLCLVPLVYRGKDSPPDYLEIFDRYWSQVKSQLNELEAKLVPVSRLYHEMIYAGGEEGNKMLKELNEASQQIVDRKIKQGAQLEAAEKEELLVEFLDWNRCLALGLQSQDVFLKVYESYSDARRKRNEYIVQRLSETLKLDEMGILFMAEDHQLQFPADIEVFYVSPPALDEIKRWFRDREAKPQES